MNFVKLFNLVSFLIATFSLEANALSTGTLTVSELSGMVANKCSGAIVNIGRNENDYAVILTNGHCMRHKVIPAGVYVKDEMYVRSDIGVFNNESKLIRVQPRNILYGTMEGADLGLIEISTSYRKLKEMGVRIFELSQQNSSPGEELFTASGFWKTSQTCVYGHGVYQLLEGNYVWVNALSMEKSCQIKGGWSGSPLISKVNGQIVGVLNTSNENGERCTMNNPCEKDQRGNVTAVQGNAYGIHTAVIWSCLSNGRVDLNKPGCKLFSSTKLKNPDDEGLTPAQKVEWLKALTNEYPSKPINIEVVKYEMQHMSTSASDKIFVNEAILRSYSVLELLFFACHELGHHFGDKKVSVHNMATEAEADYFAGSCFSHFTLKWEQRLRPFLNSYQTGNYGRCGRDPHCNKMAGVITLSYASLFGVSVFPDKALNDKFPNGINTSYPDPNCRALSSISGLLEAGRPSCWFNPK